MIQFSTQLQAWMSTRAIRQYSSYIHFLTFANILEINRSTFDFNGILGP